MSLAANPQTDSMRHNNNNNNAFRQLNNNQGGGGAGLGGANVMQNAATGGTGANQGPFAFVTDYSAQLFGAQANFAPNLIQSGFNNGAGGAGGGGAAAAAAAATNQNVAQTIQNLGLGQQYGNATASLQFLQQQQQLAAQLQSLRQAQQQQQQQQQHGNFSTFQ